MSLKIILTRLGEDGVAKRPKVTIAIKDTGCGIDPKYMKSGLCTGFLTILGFLFWITE